VYVPLPEDKSISEEAQKERWHMADHVDCRITQTRSFQAGEHPAFKEANHTGPAPEGRELFRHKLPAPTVLFEYLATQHQEFNNLRQQAIGPSRPKHFSEPLPYGPERAER